MLLNKSGLLRSVAVKFSRLNFSFLTAAHVLAAVALSYPLKMPLWVFVLLWSGVFTSAGYHFIWSNTSRNRVSKLISYANGNWCVVFAGRAMIDLSLQYKTAYLSSLVMILPFKSANEICSLMLWRDSVSALDWRILHSVLSQQILDASSTSASTRFSSKL